MEKEDSELREKLKDTEKMMLRSEWVIGIFSTVIFIAALTAASSQILPPLWGAAAAGAGIILFLTGTHFCLKIEQNTGFYGCPKCRHKYVPPYKTILLSIHVGRTRYMKCPRCGERSWQKKVLTR